MYLIANQGEVGSTPIVTLERKFLGKQQTKDLRKLNRRDAEILKRERETSGASLVKWYHHSLPSYYQEFEPLNLQRKRKKERKCI
jgi:hypothetical protein